MNSDNTSEVVILEHSHKRINILLSILAFVFIAGSITLYQIKKTQQVDVPIIYETPKGELSIEQRNKILSDLKHTEETSPPLTDTQRAKIIAEIKKANSK